MRIAMTSWMALSLCGLLLAGCESSSPGNASAQSRGSGFTPPELNIEEWLNTGQPLKLRELKGKPVVVEFWATWCPPCIESLPHLKALHEKYAPEGLVIAGIHARRGAERDKVGEFISENGIKYPIGLDTTGEMARAYRIDGYPTAYVINREGHLIWTGHPLEPEFEKKVEEAVKG